MELLGTIEGCEITVLDNGAVRWVAKAWIDTDGAPNSHGNPNHQSCTSLTQEGKAINADTVPYVVVPPLGLMGVKGTVLGCMVEALNLTNGRETVAVVGDVGPPDKIGEVSPECACRLGLSGDPFKGGEDRHVIQYTIHPGVPAVVDGVVYSLQPFAQR